MSHSEAACPAGHSKLSRTDFGPNFQWGVSVASYQIEGAHNQDGKGPSIWDEFTTRKNKIHRNENGNIACNFYHLYPHDLDIVRQLGIPNFRFSPSWSRIFPHGKGHINPRGLAFYDKLVDECLARHINPWLTLYHWDLPLSLENKGGWTNPDVVNWFLDYASVVVNKLGDRVKNWMIMNEPMVFTGAGYFMGVHAPGKRGFDNFIPSVHHATLAIAEGGRLVKSLLPQANVGTTFSCSHIDPFSPNEKDVLAAQRVDALLNRLFIEPVLGLGYPTKLLKPLARIEKYFRPGDEGRLAFDFDFIGVQNYTREIVKHTFFTPYLRANIIKAEKRKVPTTLMGWEVYPKAIYHILKQFGSYPDIKKLIVTENGAAFPDHVQGGHVHDVHRTTYLQSHIAEVKQARAEGAPVEGYFIWTLMDNFEWAEGYAPRFGIVHVDFHTQKRIIKDSGYWFKSFLEGKE